MWAVGKPVPANYTLLEAVDYHAVSQYPLLEAVAYHAVSQYLLEACLAVPLTRGLPRSTPYCLGSTGGLVRFFYMFDGYIIIN